MKDYGHNSRLNPEKKKKRKFEVIINTKTHGIYSDFTPMKVAKKVTIDLIGRKKHIIFHLREKGKSGKTYSYIGNINDGNVVVKIHKMSGGVDDYDWNNNPQLKNSFLVNCTYTSTNNSIYQFKVVKIGTELNMIIFGKDKVTIAGSIFLPYVYYLYNGNVKFKKISIQYGNILFTDVSFEDLNIKNSKNPKDSSIIYLLYKSLIEGSSQYSTTRTKEQTELKDKLIERFSQPNQQKNQTFSANSFNFYICENPAEEVKTNNDGSILFGYDENLLVKSQDGSSKFYYKYSYHNNKFYVLEKNSNETLEEKEISVENLPIYDTLCLYNSVPSLSQILQQRIDVAKKNISKIGEKFTKLDESNFNKNNNKNFGKIKKRRLTDKTYIFFGSKKPESKLLYVCFREDEKVFYYSRTDLNAKRPLTELSDIDALKDLISFILLRQISNNNKEFADIILQEAKATIKFWKTQQLSKKMINGQPQIPKPQYSLTAQPQIQNTQYSLTAQPQIQNTQYSLTAQPQIPKPQYSLTAQSPIQNTQYSLTAQPQIPKPQYSLTAHPQIPKPQYSLTAQSPIQNTRYSLTAQPPIQKSQYNLTRTLQIQNTQQKIITTSALPTSPKSIKVF